MLRTVSAVTRSHAAAIHRHTSSLDGLLRSPGLFMRNHGIKLKNGSHSFSKKESFFFKKYYFFKKKKHILGGNGSEKYGNNNDEITNRCAG